MQPHESGALFGHAQRMHSADAETGSPYWRHLMNCIAMRVAIVSAIINGFDFCASINILDINRLC